MTTNNAKPPLLTAALLGMLFLIIIFPGILYNSTNHRLSGGQIEPIEPARVPVAPVRLIFAGDIMIHSPQFKAAKSGDSYLFSPQFEEVRGLLSGADIVAGNLETTLSGGGIPYSGYPRFNTPDSILDALREAGFNLLFLANNHSMDYGTDGFARTAEQVRAGGFYAAGVDPPEGGGDILSVDVRGVKIAFLNYTYGCNAAPGQDKPGPKPAMLSRGRVLSDIAEAKAASADVVVVYPHWGVEDSHSVTDEQREMAGALREAGADIVAGAHPHVLQEIEIASGDRTQITAWSLGNFISSQRHTAQQTSVLLAVEIEKIGEDARIRKISAAPLFTETVTRPGVRKRVIPASADVEASAFEKLKITPRSAEKAKKDACGYTVLL